MEYLVIGSGAAGTRAAEALKKRDPESSVTLVTEEPQPGYYRFYLPDAVAGKRAMESVFIHPPEYYADLGVNIRLGVKIESIIPESKEVTAGSEDFTYDRLLLATGADPRKLRCEGDDLEGVVTMRSLSDAIDISRLIDKSRRAVAVGGGLLGVEMARSFRERGLEVEYLIREDRFWPAMMDEVGSRIIENNLEKNGLIMRKEETLERVVGEGGRVTGVVTDKGREIDADLVGIAIGVISRIDYLEGSGIKTDRGILVGMDLKTSVEDIYAAGDVAQAYDPVRDVHAINTSWKKAWDQGMIAALNMSGSEAEYSGGIPSNTIRIYGLPVSCLGLANPEEDGFEFFIGPYPEGETYKKLVVRDGKLVGAILVGDQEGMAMVENLIKGGAEITEARSELELRGYDLATLLP